MPQPIIAEIGSARRIIGPVTLRTVRRISHHWCLLNQGRLIERNEGQPGIEGNAVIIGVAVVIVRVIGVVLAIIRVGIAVAVTTRRDRSAGRYTCGRRADSKAGVAPEATAAIAAELATLRKLRIAASGEVGSANIGLSATHAIGLHTGSGTHACAAHLSAGGMSACPAR